MSTVDPPPDPGHPGAWGPPVGHGSARPGAGAPADLSAPAAPSGPWPPRGPAGQQACHRHPGRPAGAICRRCGQPICPECMREAPVGWQCESCIHRHAETTPETRWAPRRGTLGATRMTPVIAALIAVNVVVFVIEEVDPSVILRFDMIPAFVPTEPYRLVTAAFLHANFTHILFNMITLAVVGPAVEAAIGRSRTLALYLLAGFAGNILSFLIGAINEQAVGASGAIFGLIGAYFVLARLRGWDVSVIAPLLVVNLIFTFLDPAIDWRAHVGGLVVGAAMAYAFDRTRRLAAGARRIAEPTLVVAVLAALVLLSRLPPGHVRL